MSTVPFSQRGEEVVDVAVFEVDEVVELHFHDYWLSLKS
jgi:hypothetical protein